MHTETIKQVTEANVLHTYNRYPMVLESGQGVYLKDTDGKEYLDFASGIAVFALGYHFPGYDEALKAQIDQVIHTSNLYYNVPLAAASEKLIKASGMAKVFFTNSGAEAIEGAVKAARKYAYERDGHTDHEIIAMNNSFHGRTVGALSVTGNPHYQEAFKPLMGGVKFADFNDIASVKAAVTDKTCAILMETVQGEGGIHPADPAFLKEVRALCDEKDILLILDEIQCGMGRTGKMWAFEHYDVKPDILTSAKALGCGIPVGAFLLNEKTAARSLKPGDHGTTYGGNPLACAAVSVVQDLFAAHDIVAKAAEVAAYLAEKLDGLAKVHSCILEHRGLGLMRGLALENEVAVADVIAKAQAAGLLVISAGGNVLRLVPPLVITTEDVDKAVAILDKCLP
ncbi:MAG: aspartate aminotransferase family protein [Lachnospiraceae bacterium]|nr:aspartate aminotransferase family protein [Lachnospiraceae bacterium]